MSHRTATDNGRLAAEAPELTVPESQAAAPPDAGADPFDLESLRLQPEDLSQSQVKRTQLVVPVGKPNKLLFIRVHPDPAFRFDTRLIELKSSGSEFYLLDPSVAEELEGEPAIVYATLFLTLNHKGDFGIWPVRLTRPGDRANSWNASALQAALAAMQRWVRVLPNTDIQGYDLGECRRRRPDPVWPERSMREWLAVAFQDRRIRDMDHPVVRELTEGV
jgi:hypothetical protein